MQPKEVRRRLKALGFSFWKHGSKHEMWRKGKEVALVAHGTKPSPRIWASMRALERRLARKRS